MKIEIKISRGICNNRPINMFPVRATLEAFQLWRLEIETATLTLCAYASCCAVDDFDLLPCHT